jgi:hypothetical protein
MQIFLSYASEDRNHAELIHLALIAAGHSTFFDKDHLLPGHEFDSRISEAVNQCDALIFLISGASITAGSYALTELGYARSRWSHPAGRVLPVLLEPIQIEKIPPYLRSVGLLEPHGNIPAEVARAVNQLGSDPPLFTTVLSPQPPRNKMLRSVGWGLIIASVSYALLFFLASQGPAVKSDHIELVEYLKQNADWREKTEILVSPLLTRRTLAPASLLRTRQIANPRAPDPAVRKPLLLLHYHQPRI